MSTDSKHNKIETNIGLMIVLIIVALSFGTLVELVPLMFGKQVNEPIEVSSHSRHWPWRGATSTSARAVTPATRR